jgi:hypothetical protein
MNVVRGIFSVRRGIRRENRRIFVFHSRSDMLRRHQLRWQWVGVAPGPWENCKVLVNEFATAGQLRLYFHDKDEFGNGKT